MTETKSATFRLNKESTESFRQYCEENQLTAAQGFDYMLEVLALDKARVAIQSRETEISNFEQHAKAIISAYLHSLELNENAEQRIREQFATQLETQAVTISEYQSQIKNLKIEIEAIVSNEQALQDSLIEMQKSLNAAEETKDSLVSTVAELKETNSCQIADKDNIISMLSSKLTEAEAKASEYDALKERINALQGALTKAEQTIRDNTKDAEIALERAVREAERKMEAEHRKELQKIQAQNTELLQTIAGLEKSSAEQIRTVEKENATLREKLAKIKSEKPLKQ